jgi:hypothetical protein
MKHFRSYLAVALAIVIIVAAFPLSTHAAVHPTEVSINGTNYSISRDNQIIQVTASVKGKVVDNCTAYLNQGYMIYRDKRQSSSTARLSTVSWVSDIINSESPQKTSPRLASSVASFTKDGKYVYNPTQTKLFPKTYKSHTAYYWFQIVGTDDDARQLNIKKGTAVTEVIALLAAIIGAIATCGWGPVAAVAATSVISAGGATIANGLVSLTISPYVGVDVVNYESTFLDSAGNGSGSIFKGSKITVKTKGSRYYNQVFYEDYCPQVSQNFGLTAFLNTFKGSYIKYPGVSSYTEL